MSNPFLQVIREGMERRWCMSLHCTTCGADEFRQRLQELAGPTGGPLADALGDVDLAELMALPKWRDAVLLAIMELQYSFHLGWVLEAWVPKVQQQIRFADHILFRLVRYLPSESPARRQWIDECVAMAIRSKDLSLVESLLIVQGQQAKAYPELVALAADLAGTSKQIRRVLSNVCKIQAERA